MTDRVVLAHPSGNQFFRHLAAALRDAGKLAELCTAFDWRGGGGWGALLPGGVRRELERRNFSTELGVPVVQHPWREAMRLASNRLGWRALTRHETGFLSVDAVYRDFDRWVARRLQRVAGAGMVYAYEDAAEATFAEAARLGLRRAYDLPIAYWEKSRQLLAEESSRYPAWEPTLVGTRDSGAKLERKSRELAAADLVVCPSQFVADSLPPDTPTRARVIVAPFGSPPPGPRRTTSVRTKPLRVLFAGSMSQRKGLADVFEAVRGLQRRDIELVVLGSPVAGMGFYRRELADFIHEAPRPHADVLALMRTCDVLCLPSIVEGRALVVQEAMSQGLPVLVTPNCGVEDVVENGVSGFVVPIRNPRALAEKLNWFADHREAWPEMSRAAQAAAAKLTWVDYGAKILAGLEGVSGPRPASGLRNLSPV